MGMNPYTWFDQQQQQPSAPQPPTIQDAVQQTINLFAQISQRQDLNIDVQTKALLTLAQAHAQLTDQQPASIPPEQQMQLEVAKMEQEHALKQQELQHKQSLAEQEFALKAQMAQLEGQLKQNQAAQDAQQKAENHAHDANIKEENHRAQLHLQQRQQQHQEETDKTKLSNAHSIAQSKASQGKDKKG